MVDVFKHRCAHNRILGRLEQCEICVDAERERAIAKAGPPGLMGGYQIGQDEWDVATGLGKIRQSCGRITPIIGFQGFPADGIGPLLEKTAEPLTADDFNVTRSEGQRNFSRKPMREVEWEMVDGRLDVRWGDGVVLDVGGYDGALDVKVTPRAGAALQVTYTGPSLPLW